LQQTTLTTNTIPLPAWLPEDIRATLAGRSVSVQLPKAVRLRLRQPKKMTISEHAEQYRVVTEIDAHPGPWRPELVPHTKKIMDLIAQPSVREVWLCMVERAGKTQVLMNAVHWFVDRGGQSGNIFWLMPSEKEARGAVSDRLIPMFQASSRTARLLSSKADDVNSAIVKFNNGLRIRAAWANSPGSMASYFGRFNICDETDKYPPTTSEKTDPLTLIKKRAREDRSTTKYLFASTPRQG